MEYVALLYDLSMVARSLVRGMSCAQLNILFSVSVC